MTEVAHRCGSYSLSTRGGTSHVPVTFSSVLVQPSSRKRIIVLGLSLHRRDLGLEADKRSICPVTEELEVLKEFMAGLQDIKLIGELWG